MRYYFPNKKHVEVVLLGAWSYILHMEVLHDGDG